MDRNYKKGYILPSANQNNILLKRLEVDISQLQGDINTLKEDIRFIKEYITAKKLKEDSKWFF